MAETHPLGAAPRRSWAALGVGGLAIACLVGLAAWHLADGRGVFVAGLLVALCAAALSLPRTEASPLGAVSPPAERAPPFALMMENLGHPVLLVSGSDPANYGDRRYIFANGAARELLRLQREDGALTTAIRAPEVLAAIEQALFQGVAARADWHSRGAQERFWQARIAPLPNAEAGAEPRGAARLALLTFHDETDIRRSESTRADFLANASHELRTPLASLAGFIETLRGHARDDPAAREKFLAIMQAQAERMRHLIDDLMSLSRIELTEHIRPEGLIDLAAAARDVVDALTPQAEQRQVTFDLDAPARGRALVMGDRDQIVQVAQNLIENAIKYTPAGGVVGIRIEEALDARTATAPREAGHAHLSLLTPDRASTRRYVALSVRDSGGGIARNHLPRLTERFYRVEGQKGGQRPGTGLGLAIVKHIVNRHRGGIVVESALGGGSIFTVYIPTPEADAEAAAPPTSQVA